MRFSRLMLQERSAALLDERSDAVVLLRRGPRNRQA